MNSGKLVPDEIVCNLLMERIRQRDCLVSGFLLDGFPRNISQALMLHKSGIAIDAVIWLDAKDEVVKYSMCIIFFVVLVHLCFVIFTHF